MKNNSIPEVLKQQLAAHWETLVTRSDEGDDPGPYRTEIMSVWSVSDFALQTSLRQVAWLNESLQSQAFREPHSRSIQQAVISKALENAESEDELGRQLRILRQRQMLRIVWREMVYQASLEETLAATSDLADLLISAALDWLYLAAIKRSGEPCNSENEIQKLTVLGMGKLGGRELNFSSDIDLIFAFPDKGETNGEKAVSNELFFTRLGQRLIKALDQVTADGFVYRVDMRLRPFGESGALVQHFDGMEHYYEVHGREWERYALIKARPVAGDLKAGEDLLDRLRGFIYRRYLDYGVIESLREMKSMIARQAAKRGKEKDLKLGPGGIREIEFTVQMFQLIHGGRHRQLQQQSLQPNLDYIESQAWLTEAEAGILRAAYRFLRKAENHVQMQSDRQIHELPADETDCWRLTRSLGFDDWDTFLAELDVYRHEVTSLFRETFNFERTTSEESDEESLADSAWKAINHEDESRLAIAIEAGGLEDQNLANRALMDFMQERSIKTLSEKGRQRLNTLMPLLLAEVFQQELPAKILSRLLGLIVQIAQRSSYIAFLAERPQSLYLLIRLCETSDWITDYLKQHPLLLEELLDPVTLFAPPEKPGLQQQLNNAVSQIDLSDHEAWLDQLRHFKQTQVLRVAAADIMNALPLMKVSDHLTWIAEVLLEQVLKKCWADLVDKYGAPQMSESDTRVADFIIIGYGKMGGFEIGYGSDLDLVFLHNASGNSVTNGPVEQPVTQFFARLGQRIISVLNTFTTAGKLYEVDMRLRPSGSSGLLVSNLDAFKRYQLDQAWLWEHQALIRSRPVAGSEQLSEQFNQVRAEVLEQKREASEVAAEVLKMRQKMWDANPPGKKFDLKKSPGGITDIEFMVQYLVLAHAAEKPELVEWTDNIRILETLSATAVIEPDTAERLAEIYRSFRDTIHRLTLKGLSVRVSEDLYSEERSYVTDCWQRWLEQ